MSFLRKLFSAPAMSDDALWIYVECTRCGERLRVRVNKANDLSVAGDEEAEKDGDDELTGSDDGFVLRKEILGNNCPRLMYVNARFDNHKHVTEMTAQNCRLLTREEYEAAPPATS